MNSLITALDKMQEVLGSLSNIIKEEHEQLSAGFINSSLLQRITEDKSSLLTTLNYLDGNQRNSIVFRRPIAASRSWRVAGRRSNNARVNCATTTPITACC